MDNLEQEVLELKSTIKELETKNYQQSQIINSLNTIATSLTNFTDVSTILKQILKNVQDVTSSDGGTIYLTDGKKLSFKHIINKSMGIEHYDCDENQEIWNYLDIDKSKDNLVSVKCALTKQDICIDDVYNSTKYDFSGTKEFDAKIGYKSNTMLVVPMLLADNTLVGVIQLINKTDGNDVIKFNDNDKLLASALASQASIMVDKFRQEKALIQQSKLAAMGEMIDAVAHQWKQPLNLINILASKVDMYIDMDMPISNEMLKDSYTQISKQVNHLTDTLEEFRTFLRPNKKHQIVSVVKIIESVLYLLKDELNKNNINIEVIGNDLLTIDVIENEFKHVFINLLNNAKDAFNENKIENRKIIFNIKETIDSTIINVSDNAGGIPSEVIDTIFNANVTTKEEGKGTGIGLYMSSQIIQKNNGTINVENVDSGAMFTIKLEKIRI